MIKGIVKIKNCPSFVDFKPANNLPEFKRYNLIYGWNGSGKTCFSRILRSFEMGENYYTHPERQPEFDFKLDNERTISHNDLDAFKRIRVFNKDFVEDSVFRSEGPRPIYFLSKKSKTDKERIVALEKELGELRTKIDIKKSEFEKAKSNKDKTIQSKARDIKNALTTAKQDYYRNYDRSDIEKSISNNARKLENLEKLKLSAEHISKLNKSIQQTSRATINNITMPNLNLAEIEKQVTGILTNTVTTQVIENLQKDQEVNKWVEQGLKIHKGKTLEICAFCDQRIPPSRFKDLEKHFSDQYQRIMESIQLLKNRCASYRVNLDFPESSRLYDEFVTEYLRQKEKAEKAIDSFNERLDSILSILNQKEKDPFSSFSLEKTMPIELSYFNRINEIIKNHNQKTDDFENQIDNAKKELELHYIVEFLPMYDELCKNLKDLEEECFTIKTTIEEKQTEIKTVRDKLVSHHIPARQIQEDLHAFLGRSDIQLIATESKEGYRIIRNGEIAKNLSEGEKTALAIVYFLTKIKEEGFELRNSVVVVDDPVSSLDSNSIFQASSFIKESIKDAGQIFILTHHFDFFRQMKNWFYHCPKSERAYFMTVCREESKQRNSSILEIDKLLLDYESEYHFLFSVLYKIAEEKNHDLERIYPIPNIARKFLESFLAFRVPVLSKKNPKEPQIYQRLKLLTDFDEKKKERIRRFVETHSHPRYESGIQDFDMSILKETPDILNDIMELVRNEDKKHYDFLVESVTR
ncbi:AAA family ATPase [Candidatus Peregrinibacteria bacterium]|nr:AAA family ATPase [Candidatus Peregrinibacteria bacterium]